MIRFSAKVRYGLRTLIYLAVCRRNKPVAIRAISEDQQIPRKYLESVVQLLKTAGLVRSQRGAEGGYTLALPAEEIKMDRVFEALDGPLVLVDCLENSDACSRQANCIASSFYSSLQTDMLDHLTRKTLADVVNGE